MAGVGGLEKDRTEHTKLFLQSFTGFGHGKRCQKTICFHVGGFFGYKILPEWVSDLSFSCPSSEIRPSIFGISIFQQDQQLADGLQLMTSTSRRLLCEE